MSTIIHIVANIQLPIGHVVVSVTSHRGSLYVVTDRGAIFRVQQDDYA